jgi:alcohol dehydrogenase class IV
MFGPGVFNEIGKAVSQVGGRRVFIVTDPVLESLGIVDRVKQILDAEIEVFTGGEIEPSTETVARCAEIAREYGPDVTIAIGGGSNMDLAKLTCATVSSGMNPEALLGFDQVPSPPGSLICVPTTAGTGSEVSHSAVIRNSSTGKKEAALSHYLRPQVAVVDPELTLSCPSKLTAESGIDALTHGIEAYLATDYSVLVPEEKGILPYEGKNPMGDLYAEKCIHLAGKHFLAAVHEPDNLESRAGMSLAATLGGLAFSNCGVALAHALEYPIGERYKCAHGAGNGIVLPEVVRFLEKVRGDRLSKIGELLRVDALPEAAIKEVSRLRREAGLPECLRDVGADQSDLNDLAATSASLKRLMDLSPITPSEADLRRILEASF